MGIMTEEVKPSRAMLDDTEFVRTKRYEEPSMKLVFGRGTLTLSEKCVLCRNTRSAQRTVTVIPFKNIDSFSIQIRRSYSLLVVGVVLLLLALGSGLWVLSTAAMAQPAGYTQSSPPVSPLLKHFLAPSISLACGFIFLVTYSIYRRIELMICSASGNNRVKVLLPIKLSDSVEQFVAALETQILAT